MSNPVIICVDDQADVLATIVKDLDIFSSRFDLIDCQSAAEALAEMDTIDEMGRKVAVILADCVMPEKSGVEFLSDVLADGRFKTTRKLLLTGQASHQDTIDAINIAHIDAYVGKPWDKEKLIATVKILLTHFIFDVDYSYSDYYGLVDSDVIMERMQ